MNPNASTVRKKYYDNLIKELVETGVVHKVPYKSNTEYTDLPVYEIPIGKDFETGLRFNLDNTRIIRYVLAEEKKRGRLDPEKPETQEFISNILQKEELYSKGAINNLKDDLRDSGQRDPVIISCDGVIWNGNRRVSAIKSLHKATGDPKWGKVLGVFLPRLDKKNLKQLEHRLQVAPTFKEEYDRITLFLDCRKRIEEGWEFKELENSFNGRYKVRTIKKFIEQINLIDEYLARIGQEGNYPILGEKGAEFFSSAQAHLEKEAKRFRTSAAELNQITTEFFAAYRDKKSTYRDARKLSKILSNEHARTEYLKNSPIYNNYPEYTTPDKTGQEKAFSMDVTSDVVRKITVAHAELVASSAASPLDIVEKVLKKLDTIKVEDIERGDDEFLEILDQVESRLNRLREYAHDV